MLRVGESCSFRHGDPRATQELELGHHHVYTDSSAALGTCNRLELGKSRHIQTRFLWVQEKLAERAFELFKIDTKLNTADICTKALASEAVERRLKAMADGF